MKLRNRLILAFFLLAVVPLASIVLYHYHSSRNVFRLAVEAEAEKMAWAMRSNLDAKVAELDQDLKLLDSIPFETLADSALEDGTLLAEIEARMGEDYRLIESLAFQPRNPPGNDTEPPEGSAAPKGQRGMVVIHLDELRRRAEILAEKLKHKGSPTRALEIAELEKELRTFAEGLVEPSGLRQESLSQLIDAWAPLAPEAPPTPPAPEGPEAPKVKIEATWVARGPDLPTVPETDLECPVEMGGEVVGQLRAKLREPEIVRRVLASTPETLEDIPFAVDPDGGLHVLREDDRRLLEPVVAVHRLTEGPNQVTSVTEDWVVVTAEQGYQGYELGVARPVGESLREMNRAAARGFGYGLILIGLCLGGILPLSNRMTRNLSSLSQGVSRLADGDLEVTVAGADEKDELGQLAGAFNHMAAQLKEHRRRLVEGERQRKEQEIERRLLAAENHRKSVELEEARSFQLSLLPQSLPQHPCLEVAVSMRTATEVGGDYYDFDLADDGTLTAVVGDATGHGAAAGTMVTVIKSLFSARGPEMAPARFLEHAARTIERMQLGRMAMALALLRLDGDRLTLASAAMPPLLLFRRETQRVEEVEIPGLPLGSRPEVAYHQRELTVSPGDAVLLMTDGFPELLNPGGDPLGYGRALDAFERAAASGTHPQGILESLVERADGWAAGRSLYDDLTFVVIKVRDASADSNS